MSKVSVISAPVKPDEPAPHGRNNGGKASNHEMISDQCKTGHKMINCDNQRDLNMPFYETSRYYDRSETNVMPIYQRNDSVSDQLLTPPLPVLYPPQHLIIIPSFSAFYYVVPIFQYWCPITLPNMMKMRTYVLPRHQQIWQCERSAGVCMQIYLVLEYDCAAAFINECFLLSFHVMILKNNALFVLQPSLYTASS